ncbi:MAG: hypothetical protein ABIV47_26545 [Roseiflexaceae bacterium]
MRIRRNFSFLSATLMVVMLLAACGGAPAPAAEVPTAPAAADAPAATSAPDAIEASDATEIPEATDATAAPEATPLKAEGETTGGTSAEGSVETSGSYVADLGFRPDANGFGFPNYGGQGETNLTPADLQRMFGNTVCASTDGGECTLTPPGNQWLQQINTAMNGGHCEGMAVLSNLFYTGKINAADFGADSVPALQIAGNEPLQREIAYWWATQSTQPSRSGIVAQTPSGVVNTLLTSFAAGREGSDQYAVGIYKRDRTGGHAITPYAVEDRGNGVYWILVYDNNYPAAARSIEVDTTADTWRYSGSTNPAEPADEYEGDAETKTLELAPISPRLGQQDCPFCDPPAAAYAGGDRRLTLAPQATTIEYNEIWLEGDADLLISDTEGHRMGFEGGKFINEIPGAKSNGNKFGVNVWDIEAEPVYYIPTNIDFSISIDGSHLTQPMTSTVTMIGPGYALEVSDIILEPGQVDTLDVSPDGSLLSYRTASGETPFMLVAIETEAADYQFGVYGEEMAAGEALNLSLDTKQGWLSIDAIDNKTPGSYSLVVAKYDDQGEQVFGADGIELAPDDIVYVDYLKWPGNGKPMALDVDKGSDGSVDQTLEVDDVTDTLKEE